MSQAAPRARKLKELAQAKKYPTLHRCEIHVGEQDWQSDPEHVSEFGKLLNVQATVVPKTGHMLPRDYVTTVLDEWLNLKPTVNDIQ